MTTLSAHTTRAIHNKGMQAVYGIAAEYDVPVEDVIALLGTTSHTSITGHQSPFVRLPVTTPSQPEPTSLAPAADPSIAPTVDVKAEGEPHKPSATPDTPSAGTDGEQAPVGGILDPAAPTSLPGAEGADDRAPIAFAAPPSKPRPQQADIDRDAATVLQAHVSNPDWTARMISRGLNLSTQRVVMLARSAGVTLPTQVEYDAAQRAKIAEKLKRPAAAQPASDQPQPDAVPQEPVKTIRQRVAEAHQEHPDWGTEDIAVHTGAKLDYVKTALHDIRAAAGTLVVEPPPQPNPQTPVAPPPAGERRTLTDRIRALHHQYPNWTASLIAKELGANPNSVSAILAGIRNPKAQAAPAPKAEFSSRREMLNHYDEIAKRLGKVK